MTTEPTKSDAENIREEQGTHAPGTVPPGDFGKAGETEPDSQRPEDARPEPEGADD